MNEESYKLCEKLIPPTYVQQGSQAKRVHENKVRQLLEQVSETKYPTISLIIAQRSTFLECHLWFLTGVSYWLAALMLILKSDIYAV